MDEVLKTMLQPQRGCKGTALNYNVVAGITLSAGVVFTLYDSLLRA